MSLFSPFAFERCNQLLFSFAHNELMLIGVKGGDSSGKSVSRCDPTESESERGGTRTTRGKRPPVTEIDIIFIFHSSCLQPVLR